MNTSRFRTWGIAALRGGSYRSRHITLTACFFCLGIMLAQAQTKDLITPIPQDELSAAARDQSERITQLRQQRTTKHLELVRIDLNVLKEDSARVTIPGQRSLSFSKQSMETKDSENFIWHGKLPDVPGTATLVVRQGNVTGTVNDGQNLYHIEPVGGGVHAIVTIDISKLPPEHPPGFEKGGRRQNDRRPQLEDRPAGSADSPVGIDLLVAYTPSAKASVTDIDATIQLAVAEANQSYVNSGVNIKLNVVDSFQHSYTEAGKTFDTILDDFMSNTDVKNRRNTSGADLSALIINQSDYCGMADAILASAESAFAVVHYSCATGYFSFAHELGHLMGARHDPNTDSTNTPFPYGHGYQHPSSSANQRFRTIMGYACTSSNTCDPRVQFWSNPNVNFNGIAMGTATTHDNHRVLNETAGTMAGFRKRVRTGDVLWQHINGQVHYWPMLNGQRQGGNNIFTPVGPEWKLLGAGDFNGDGTDDILWQHINGQVHYWPMLNGQRQGGNNIFTPVGPDWKLAGAGDLNGDGTDDILWQHINGQVHFWPMLNGQRQGGINIFTPVGPEWKLVGAASVD